MQMKQTLQIKKIGALALFTALTTMVFGQTEYAYQTYQDTRIVNGHSIETNQEGTLKFIISHRFGSMSGGAYELFGLDASTIRFGLDYGITNNITIGFGRSSFEKTFDGLLKIKFLNQSSGDKNMPFTATYLAGMAVKGQKWDDPNRTNYFTARLFYTHQLLIARKFSDNFSLQVMPTLVHRNLVPNPNIANDVVALGIAPRLKVSKNFTLTAEYYYVLPNQLADGYRNSLAIGFNIDTKRHVFQIQVGNSQGMTEKFFVSETQGNWLTGDIYLGFNISRDFTVKGRKY